MSVPCVSKGSQLRIFSEPLGITNTMGKTVKWEKIRILQTEKILNIAKCL
jgi:hypothetical protein